MDKPLFEKDAEIMLGVPEEDAEVVELIQHRAMVEMPENAVEITIDAKVYHDGELISVKRKMDMSEIREAFQKADDGYIDDDDRFVLTDKGMAFFDEQSR